MNWDLYGMLALPAVGFPAMPLLTPRFIYLFERQGNRGKFPRAHSYLRCPQQPGQDQAKPGALQPAVRHGHFCAAFSGLLRSWIKAGACCEGEQMAKWQPNWLCHKLDPTMEVWAAQCCGSVPECARQGRHILQACPAFSAE